MPELKQRKVIFDSSKGTIEGDLYRSFSLDESARQEIDVEKRTVPITFSSEDKLVDRFFGMEQLVHTKDAADLDRLNDGGALLKDHDRTLQIGVIEEARIDEQKKVGRALVRFSKGDLGDSVFQDVVDGIVRNVSVGFRIRKFEETEREGEANLVRILEWEAFEISFVSIPADETIGVGRAEEIIKPKIVKRKDKKMTLEELLALQKAGTITDEQKRELDVLIKANAPAPNLDAVRSEARREAKEAEQSRVKEINSVAEKFKGNDAIREMAKKAIEEDMPADEFKGRALIELGEAREVVPNAPPEANRGSHLGMPEADVEAYSLRKMLASRLNNSNIAFDGIEKEAHDQLVKRFGQPVGGGVYVPMDVQMRGASSEMIQRATQVAGTGSLGGYLVEQTNMGFIDILRNNTVMKQVGVQTISGLVGDVAMPRQNAASSFQWVAEQGSAASSNITFDQIQMTPKHASGQVPMSRQLLMQSDPSIDLLVQNDLAMVLGIGTDLAIIAGTGTSAQPRGILNTTGVGSNDMATADWVKTVALETTVANANGLTGSPQFVSTPGVRGTLKTRKKDAGSGIFIWENNEVNGYPGWATTNMPANNGIFGDFSTVVLGEWGVLEIRTIDQGPNFAKGEVILLAFVSLDVAVRQPAKLTKFTNFS